jgi:hypothetical protein
MGRGGWSAGSGGCSPMIAGAWPGGILPGATGVPGTGTGGGVPAGGSPGHSGAPPGPYNGAP